MDHLIPQPSQKEIYSRNSNSIGYFAVASIDKSKRPELFGFDNTNIIASLNSILNTKSSKFTVRELSYRGSSICRCCGQINGSREHYVIFNKKNVFIIPEGYTHTLSHGIMPDPNLEKLFEAMQVAGFEWVR